MELCRRHCFERNHVHYNRPAPKDGARYSTLSMSKKNVVAYFLVLAVFGSAIWVTIHMGPVLSGGSQRTSLPSNAATQETNQAGNSIIEGIHKNLQSPLSRLLLQIILITVVARVFGTLVVKIGQPRVIGEMIAGILLGPSFLGFFSPVTMDTLFPASSMENLRMLSELGVVLFMFLVGTDVNLGDLWKKAHTAIWVSHASIVIPFFLGTAVSLFLYPSFAPAGIAFKPFALFMGVAMSITAFPVLARIVQERNMTQSEIGIMSLGCAAVDDATAWCILAVVLALVKSESPWACGDHGDPPCEFCCRHDFPFAARIASNRSHSSFHGQILGGWHSVIRRNCGAGDRADRRPCIVRGVHCRNNRSGGRHAHVLQREIRRRRFEPAIASLLRLHRIANSVGFA